MKEPIKKIIPIFIIFILLASSGLIAPSVTYALSPGQAGSMEGNDINCYSLDVVFLIDQSGSMTYVGAKGWTKASDLSELRLKTVKWAIDWLGDNVLSSCPEAIHRIGVISWGTTAQVDFVETIAPKTDIEWRTERNRIKNQVQWFNLGFTKPDLAFEEAQNIFSQFDIDILGDLPRKKVIIFLTDGIPYPPISRGWIDDISSDFLFDATLLDQEDCLVNAVTPEDKNNCLGNFAVTENAYENSVHIWSILLNANQMEQEQEFEYSEYTEFVQDMQQISKSHGGQQVSITHFSQIPPTILDILTTLAGTKAVAVDCNPFSVDPYLQQATLSIFKINKDVPITISYVDGGNTYTITQKDVEGNTTWPLVFPGFTVKDFSSIDDPETESSIERYVFLRPHTSEWSISAPTQPNCDGIQASFESLDIDVKLVSPSPTVSQYDQEPFYDESSPVYIEYQLIDRGSQAPIEEEPNYRLKVKTTLTGSDGKIKDFDLIYNPSTKTYKSEAPLSVNVIGRYTLVSRATTSVKEEDDLILFDGETSSFEVTETLPFKINIIEPKLNNIYSLHDGPKTNFSVIPMEFRVVVTDRSKNNIDPALIFKDPNLAFQGTVSLGDEKFPISFAIDPESLGEFIGTITTLKEEGNYHLSVSVKDEEAYAAKYRPDNKIVETDFILQDTVWTRPVTYKILGIALLALIIAIIIAIALNRNNPAAGTLVFELGSENIADISISTGWNVAKIKRSTLNAYPSLGLKSLKAYKSREQLGSVEYQAVDMSGNRYNGTLMPNNTSQFASGMTVRYEPL